MSGMAGAKGDATSGEETSNKFLAIGTRGQLNSRVQTCEEINNDLA